MNTTENINDIEAAAGVMSDLLTAQELLFEAMDDEFKYNPARAFKGEVHMLKGRASAYIAAFSGMNCILNRLRDDIDVAVSAEMKEQAARKNPEIGGAHNV